VSQDGSLPSGKDIGRQHDRHERWGRLVKHAGLAGQLDTQTADYLGSTERYSA
jgi:hypothetical protein